MHNQTKIDDMANEIFDRMPENKQTAACFRECLLISEEFFNGKNISDCTAGHPFDFHCRESGKKNSNSATLSENHRLMDM